MTTSQAAWVPIGGVVVITYESGSPLVGVAPAALLGDDVADMGDGGGPPALLVDDVARSGDGGGGVRSWRSSTDFGSS